MLVADTKPVKVKFVHFVTQYIAPRYSAHTNTFFILDLLNSP